MPGKNSSRALNIKEVNLKCKPDKAAESVKEIVKWAFNELQDIEKNDE